MSHAANRLAHQTSPYLLQHAHNPVDWYPWGPEALARARTEQKPILVSIGYAACHWCHVMAKESFADEAVAAVMNKHFVCIKVDREERPDVDQLYLDAVQAMGVGGGWPLNVFLTAEAKPFYGGTYVAREKWLQLLTDIGEGYAGAHRTELEGSAERFARAVSQPELEKFSRRLRLEHAQTADDARPGGVSDAEFQRLVANFQGKFDHEHGGMRHAPKFPLPGVWRFLLRCYALSSSRQPLDQAVLTLREMAWGGIYDQAHGGFARYAVDERWRVPHFEKMLCDNGQLISLYAEAYQLIGDELFRNVVYDTIEFVRLELTSPEGGFYAALDADSEGEEGRFYVFTKAELQEILGPEEPLFSAYYNCTANGNWEHGRNILYRRQTDADFAAAHQLSPETLAVKVEDWKHHIMQARIKRVRPATDHKILTSWNALMLLGLCDAYRAFYEPEFLVLAERNARFLLRTRRYGAQLYRTTPSDKASIGGFLDDYALFIQALVQLYEVSFVEDYLHEARALCDYVLAHFFDPAEQLFFFTDQQAEPLIARKKELVDNVLPSSNSVMAHNLHRLGRHYQHAPYTDLAAAMLARVRPLVVQEPHHFSNWAALYAAQLRPGADIAILGPDAEELRAQLAQCFLPDVVVAGTDTGSPLPLLQLHHLPPPGRTAAYVCQHQMCLPPLHSASDVLHALASDRLDG